MELDNLTSQSIKNELPSEWLNVITPSISALRQIAGTTEDEFLQIGSQLHSFYQRSADISSMARQLVSVVSGDNIVSLTSRLHQIMVDMEEYLHSARARSSESCSTLEQVQQLLDRLSEPLEGFQKMNKVLRMLSISTKIESARLGELGSGFVNLAMDVEKLSHQVHEKSAAILNHRQMLATMIANNLAAVHTAEANQKTQVTTTLAETATNLQSLVEVNERCTSFGSTVASISTEVTDSISDVVSSMQMHDMTRQQLEHIVEALEKLSAELTDPKTAEGGSDNFRRVVIEAGDVCELQEAQLRFASGELYSAVCIIIDNLREVAGKQSIIVDESVAITGSTDSGSSFVDVMSKGMTSVTSVLAACAWADDSMADTMKSVAGTIGEIAAFVTDIEAIGSEIELIALNSQVKAALTGSEGAALGVLAEAIKRLSDEAVRQTDVVAATLNDIHSVTAHLLSASEDEACNLSSRITTMQDELAVILRTLADMNGEMLAILGGLNERVFSLTDDVQQATAGVDVHERIKAMSNDVLVGLDLIVSQSREIEPASSQFKENLRHMEERYTMESERHIHEAIARKRSGQSAAAADVVVNKSADESEFGDNFDLF